MNMELKFLKIRDVKSPARGTAEAAGIDFFVPNYNTQFAVDFREKNPEIDYAVFKDVMEITLEPGQRVLIPSGIKTWMTPGTALIAANKYLKYDENSCKYYIDETMYKLKVFEDRYSQYNKQLQVLLEGMRKDPTSVHALPPEDVVRKRLTFRILTDQFLGSEVRNLTFFHDLG